MNAIIITPPLVQLNSPYPSGAYLTSYFKSCSINARWYDLNIELFYSIFSSSGLKKLFELSEKSALKMADDAEQNGDENTAFNLRRYISTKNNWINWIDTITAILCGKAREKEHQFLYSPFAPRGNRMENFLGGLDHEPTVDDVRFLCSYALADLADYITAVFDQEFSLIRYAEHLTVDERDFSTILKGLDSPVLKNFFEPVLERLFLKEDFVCPELFLISIPFAGTFLPSLYIARFIKQHFGEKTSVSIGGGFVNTELRDFNDISISKYIDFISYDRGYGSYKSLIENKNLLNKSNTDEKPVYKLARFTKKYIAPLWSDKDYEKYEEEVTTKIIPDYSDIDFSKYPRVCDDKNAMHRLWSDGAWVKAYLAHGCYWHKCAFCDTKLDYVCGYKMVDVERLYNGLLETARAKGVYGIHFVDEALPPLALKKFALLNAQHGNPLYFWGNVRFEKSFTKDFAAFLSYCGFGGASAGLEVATGSGLKKINKGTDIESIVNSCAAFKEAGILVHAYMIYGFWNDTAQTIIDSMETLRQFFAAGLLDSSFWHKFVLTRNSTVYAKWQNGEQPDLNPVEAGKNVSMFAKNNLHFKGERDFEKFSLPLENALNSWMHGEKLEMKVQKWFDFAVPAPTISRDYVEQLIEKYENNNKFLVHSEEFLENGSEIYWLGSEITVSKDIFRWIYFQEEYSLRIDKKSILSSKSSIINSLSPTANQSSRESALQIIKKSPELLHELQRFHNKGLVLL